MSRFVELKEELLKTNPYFCDMEMKNTVSKEEISKKQSQLWYNLYKTLYKDDPVGFSGDVAIVYCYYNFNLITNYLAGLSKHRIYASLPSIVINNGYSILGGRQMYLLIQDMKPGCRFKIEDGLAKIYNQESEISFCTVDKADPEYSIHEKWLQSWSHLPFKPYVKNLNNFFFSKSFSDWVLEPKE